MSVLAKLKFPALDIGGANYVVWSLEAKNYLCADGLDDTIDESFALPTGNSTQNVTQRKNASRACCLLLRHLHKDLKTNYLEERNPATIWASLSSRFDTDRKQTMLPLLNDEWNKLCFYNFKTVNDFASKLYNLTSELSWCGKKISESEKIEKTLSTFNPAERILSSQYRRMNYDTFDKLVAALLLEEKHGILLQRNHDERRLPPDSTTTKTPDANFGDAGRRRERNEGKNKFRRGAGGKKRWKQNRKQRNGRSSRQKDFKPGSCHKCGLPGHWANKCHTSEFHCKLYQESKRTNNQDDGTTTETKKKKSRAEKKTTFMTDFSDDSGAESHCIEIYSSESCQTHHFVLLTLAHRTSC